MKKLGFLIFVVSLLVSGTIIAQDDSEMRTLFTNNSTQKMSHGGYGSFNIGYTQIDGKDAMVIGGRAAWIANHRFALGFAGYGFLNSINKDYNDYNNPASYFITGGYGGLFIEPILLPKYPVHVSFPVIMGVGGVTAIQSQDWSNSNSYHNVNYYDSDVFLVLEPGVDVEFNIVKFFRLSLGASYRFTNKINLVYKYLDNNYEEQRLFVNSNALDSFTFNIGFKFGWF